MKGQVLNHVSRYEDWGQTSQGKPTQYEPNATLKTTQIAGQVKRYQFTFSSSKYPSCLRLDPREPITKQVAPFFPLISW